MDSNKENRDLKFRAWNSADEMFEYFDIQELLLYIKNCSYEDYQYTDVKKIQQCIGIRDKNSTFIYEGDIVKVNQANTVFDKISDYDNDWRVSGFGVIKYRNDILGYSISGSIEESPYRLDMHLLANFELTKYYEKYGSGLIAAQISKRLEVIGNIFENPEILEERIQEQKEILSRVYKK